MIITGNPNYGLAQALHKIYPDAVFCSRETGYDLTNKAHQERFAKEAVEHDVIINLVALWRFNQTTLLDAIYKACTTQCPHIICVGSTTDRVKKGGSWLYNAEKKALRDYCNTLAINSVWSKAPKVSLISFGTLSNNQIKHPDRKCMDIDEAATYIKWLINQPKYVNINEISIDPMQNERWYD